MKVILTQDVRAQGKKGEMINVSDGYARNFLLPKGLAVEADSQALNELKNREAALEHKKAVEKQNALELAQRFESALVKIKIPSGADGRLYGSVTSKDIAEAVSAQLGLEVDKRKLVMPEQIKTYGSYTIDIKLYPEITGRLSVVVCDVK